MELDSVSPGRDDVRDLVRRSFHLMEVWDDAEAGEILHPDSVNHEAVSEPPAARGPGPQAYRATVEWLHAAYTDLRWTLHEVVVDGDLSVARVTMSGRHTGPFRVYSPDGTLDQVFPPPTDGSRSPRCTCSGCGTD